jgi:hypothetical protein
MFRLEDSNLLKVHSHYENSTLSSRSIRLGFIEFECYYGEFRCCER